MNKKEQQGDVEHEKALLRYNCFFSSSQYAETRVNTYNSKFIDLEIQIASIVVGILGATAFLGQNPSKSMLWVIISSAGFLIISLLFGLYSIFILKKFWRNILQDQRMKFDIWNNYLLKGGNYEQTFIDTAQISKSSSNIVDSPNWPHILQTVALFIGLLTSTVVGIISLLGKY